MFNRYALLKLTCCHLLALYRIETQILPNGVLKTPRVEKKLKECQIISGVHITKIH